MAAQSIMHGHGISDLKSYWHKLRTWIVLSMFVLALAGAGGYGLRGFFLGGALGFVAPAALIWIGMFLIGITAYLAVYCLAWAAIWTVFWWLLHS